MLSTHNLISVLILNDEAPKNFRIALMLLHAH